MSEKIIVTGGAGFIGSHLVEALLAAGHQVAVIDDLSGGYKHNLPSGVTFYKADIRSAKKMQQIFGEFHPTVVYHLAANAAESKAQFSPMDITSRNFEGAVTVLTAAINAKIRRFIFTSSIAVYGAGQTPFTESVRPTPEDVYGITKYAFEQVLEVMSAVHGFEYVIVRPHNVYGPRQNMRDPYRNVVTIFMNALLATKPIYIYGDGSQIRCFTYISEVTEALAACLSAPVHGKIFNIGSNEPTTVSKLLDLILQTTGKTTSITHLPLRPQEVMTAVSDHTVAEQYFPSIISVPLKQGLQKTWEWVLTQGYQPPIFDTVEIESTRLPENWRK